jgi:hypothetical protein
LTEKSLGELQDIVVRFQKQLDVRQAEAMTIEGEAVEIEDDEA